MEQTELTQEEINFLEHLETKLKKKSAYINLTDATLFYLLCKSLFLGDYDTVLVKLTFHFSSNHWTNFVCLAFNHKMPNFDRIIQQMYAKVFNSKLSFPIRFILVRFYHSFKPSMDNSSMFQTLYYYIPIEYAAKKQKDSTIPAIIDGIYYRNPLMTYESNYAIRILHIGYGLSVANPEKNISFYITTSENHYQRDSVFET